MKYLLIVLVALLIAFQSSDAFKISNGRRNRVRSRHLRSMMKPKETVQPLQAENKVVETEQAFDKLQKSSQEAATTEPVEPKMENSCPCMFEPEYKKEPCPCANNNSTAPASVDTNKKETSVTVKTCDKDCKCETTVTTCKCEKCRPDFPKLNNTPKGLNSTAPKIETNEAPQNVTMENPKPVEKKPETFEPEMKEPTKVENHMEAPHNVTIEGPKKMKAKIVCDLEPCPQQKKHVESAEPKVQMENVTEVDDISNAHLKAAQSHEEASNAHQEASNAHKVAADAHKNVVNAMKNVEEPSPESEETNELKDLENEVEHEEHMEESPNAENIEQQKATLTKLKLGIQELKKHAQNLHNLKKEPTNPTTYDDEPTFDELQKLEKKNTPKDLNNEEMEENMTMEKKHPTKSMVGDIEAVDDPSDDEGENDVAINGIKNKHVLSDNEEVMDEPKSNAEVLSQSNQSDMKENEIEEEEEEEEELAQKSKKAQKLPEEEEEMEDEEDKVAQEDELAQNKEEVETAEEREEREEEEELAQKNKNEVEEAKKLPEEEEEEGEKIEKRAEEEKRAQLDQKEAQMELEKEEKAHSKQHKNIDNPLISNHPLDQEEA